jgi:hypothetical protein
MSSADFEALATALEKAPIVGGLKELTSAVVQQVPSLKRQEIEQILRTVFSLCVLVTDEKSPLSENLAILTDVMQASARPELKLTEEEKADFEKRLDRLLKISVLTTSAKVQRLRFDYSNTFSDAHVITDMRPIFDKPGERPVGCAIAHTLKLEYHEGGDHKEFYVALDADDVETLKKALQRAEIKAASLKSVLKLAELPDLS